MRLLKYLVLFILVTGCALTVRGQRNDFAAVNFRKADSMANLYRHHSLQDLHLLTYRLTHPLHSDVEKFRAIYKWVCDNIKNDVELFSGNKYKREVLKTESERKEWNIKLTRETFRRLVKDKMTVCTGYAYLIREMCTAAGINAAIIDGYGRTINANIEGKGISNHSWNAVQLNDKWYLCDATWSSGAVDTTRQAFVKKYVDAYFLADPKLFIRSHYPLDTRWILAENYPSLQSFLYAPIIYPAIYRYGITSLVPELFNQVVEKKSSFIIRLIAEKPIHNSKVRLELDNNNGGTILRPIVISQSGEVTISHRLLTKGIHIVHLIIDHEYICSYRVQVR